MARGGFRPGAGRPKGSKSGRVSVENGIPSDVLPASAKSGMTPLEYMLGVMRNTEADQARRDRMAIAAAPFVHARADTVQEGKKAQRQAAAEVSASEGRFAVPEGPTIRH